MTFVISLTVWWTYQVFWTANLTKSRVNICSSAQKSSQHFISTIILGWIQMIWVIVGNSSDHSPWENWYPSHSPYKWTSYKVSSSGSVLRLAHVSGCFVFFCFVFFHSMLIYNRTNLQRQSGPNTSKSVAHPSCSPCPQLSLPVSSRERMNLCCLWVCACRYHKQLHSHFSFVKVWLKVNEAGVAVVWGVRVTPAS